MGRGADMELLLTLSNGPISKADLLMHSERWRVRPRWMSAFHLHSPVSATVLHSLFITKASKMSCFKKVWALFNPARMHLKENSVIKVLDVITFE